MGRSGILAGECDANHDANQGTLASQSTGAPTCPSVLPGSPVPRRRTRPKAMPQVYSMDPAMLAAVKSRLAARDASLRPALEALVQDAEKALKLAPASVMDKPEPLPGGDKHDYVSYAPYFWPNPDKKDGLPYVRHDGKRNRDQVAKGDAPSVREDDRHGQHARLRLRIDRPRGVRRPRREIAADVVPRPGDEDEPELHARPGGARPERRPRHGAHRVRRHAATRRCPGDAPVVQGLDAAGQRADEEVADDLRPMAGHEQGGRRGARRREQSRHLVRRAGSLPAAVPRQEAGGPRRLRAGQAASASPGRSSPTAASRWRRPARTASATARSI